MRLSPIKYAYDSEQDSVLKPYYQKWVWGPLLEFIPESWSPNSLTFLSTSCCALSFLLASQANPSFVGMLAAGFLVFAYVSLDNMDGAHARRTGKSSRLGEFLDHWLDTLNNGFVVLGACFAVGLEPFLTLLVFSATNLAFYGVQLELRYTGVFRMGRVADIEGNTAVSGLYILIALFGREVFLAEPISGGPSLALIIGLGVMGQALWTLFTAAKRLDGKKNDFIPISAFCAVLIIWFLTGAITSSAALAIAFFVNPVFTSRPILARVLDQSTTLMDGIAVLSVVLGFLISIFMIDSIAMGWLVALIMIAITSRYAFQTVLTLLSESNHEAP